MPSLNTSHDLSGHRYGEGKIPVGAWGNKALSSLKGSIDKKKRQLEKQNKDKDKTAEDAGKVEPPKPPQEGGTGVQITLGDSIPKHPSGDRPSPVKRGVGGKFEHNAPYSERKQADTDFNAGLREQMILQNHSLPQFGEHMVKVPGKPIPATGYGPTNKKAGTTNKARMGTIQETAQRIEKIRAATASMRRPQPPENTSTGD